jgi:3-methyladenine DNA glycosylase AlkC
MPVNMGLPLSSVLEAGSLAAPLKSATCRRIDLAVPEPFKNLINPQTVRAAAHHLQRAWPGFDRARFEQLAGNGLEALELKARAMQIASALEGCLPPSFAAAATVIETSLGPPLPEHEGVAQARDDAAGLSGWVVWPLGEYVARRGQQDAARALACLHALTQRFSAEWAIRPFIVHHPELCFATLRRWTQDPSAHVRRLVSEGSRPRLPWGLQLKALILDPSPTLPLLERLQNDPSAYVRRSVANHLNDIAKDHPAWVAQWLEHHLPGSSAEGRALLRHASRTLIKRGDPRVLAAWGLGKAFKGQALLSVAPRRLRVGDTVELRVELIASARRAQSLVLDYAVHHVKANGSVSAKVFKGWSLTLSGGEHRHFTKRHSMRAVTTRRYFAGTHRVELQINGQVVAAAAFELLA